MSLTSIRRAYEAGYRVGWRDGKGGRPESLFPEQRWTTFGLGYLAGYQAGQVGPQETWSDFVADLVLEHDIGREESP